MTERMMTRMKPYPLGAHVENGAVRFSFVSGKDDCGILIYDRKTGKRLKKIAFEAQERIGNVHCKWLTEFDPEEIAYQFYEGDEIVPDRFARSFTGSYAYGKERRPQDWKAALSLREFDWRGDVCPRIPYSESVCYCAHVRGFTRHVSSGVAHRGTFLGMAEKLDYLKETGITAVELQPVYEFGECLSQKERRDIVTAQNPSYMASKDELDLLFRKRYNYWGYKEGYYYAPKAAYAAGDDPCTEFKEMVHAFHQKGMEVILQFYFPRNIRALEITEILKFWVLEYHVDGFHLMGADLPVDMIAADELLADTKLWYYYFNADQIYPAGGEPEQRNLAVYGDEYLYTMRKYLKGDENMLSAVLAQMRRIPEKTGRIHYMSNYYGFTLMDMVSYDRKHNEANGEDNRDGSDFNYSWNCGEEGNSRRRKITALRHRQIKNAMTLLLFSQSTPLIFMGDEFGNSQKGNNNPYCQDNSVTWLDWNDLNRNADLYSFWKKLTALRREHPILHPREELKGMDYISCGYPDWSCHGQSAWRPRTESYNRHIGIMYCGKYAERGRHEDDFFYLALNMYWEPRTLAMPKLPAGMKWSMALCTEEGAAAVEKPGAGSPEGALSEPQADLPAEKEITVPPRSCAVYVSVPDRQERKRGRGAGKTAKKLKNGA